VAENEYDRRGQVSIRPRTLPFASDGDSGAGARGRPQPA